MNLPRTDGGTRNPRRMLLIAVLVGIVVVVGGIAAIYALPMALRGPQIVSISPADGQTDVDPYESIIIEFDQSVQAETVADSVHFDPPVNFDVQMIHKMAAIIPLDGLNYATTYNLTVDTGIKNTFGRTLDASQEVRFTTLPYVTVEQVSPADGATSIAPETSILVTFAQPVVSAEAVAAAADNPHTADTMPHPLTLQTDTGDTPQDIAGVGRWLSPTRYAFSPDGGLPPGTTCRVTVRPDLDPDGAARMEAPHSWEFSTSTDLPVAVHPAEGATEVSTDSAIEIRLPVAVDTSSDATLVTVKAADSDETVPGTLQHRSDGGLVFQPETPLQRGVVYHVSLPETLPTSSGAQVEPHPNTWDFTTIGDLAVEQTEPPPDTRDMPVDATRISVRFNHPVVALVSVDAEETLPDPLTITPPIEGVGRWLDTRTYVYSPTSRLDAATTYRVQVAEGLNDQTGGTLPDAYTWNFTTASPVVVKTMPGADEELVGPESSVTVVFDQPMDAASIQAALTVQRADTGEAAPGTVTMNQDNTVATFTPTPAEPLARGTTYRISVTSDARAIRGDATLAESVAVNFTTAPLPALTDTNPTDGEQDANPSSSVMLSFSAPMDWDTVRVNVIPEPAGAYTHTSPTTLYYYAAFAGETRYEVTVAGGAQDIYGETIEQGTSFTFQTDALAPSLSLIGGYRVGTYSASSPPRVALSHLNVTDIAYRIYRLEPEQAARLLGDYEEWNTFDADPSNLVASETLPLEAERNHQAVTFIEPGTLDAGVYYLTVQDVTATTPSTGVDDAAPSDRQVMVVTPYALTLKRSANQVFAWVVDMESGEPVADLPLQRAIGSYEDEQYRLGQRDLGRTDSNGVLLADDDLTEENGTLYIWSQTQDTDAEQFVFATSQWSDGISPWSFDINATSQPATFVGSVFTERPIYRPEQVVYIRGAVRAKQGTDYQPPVEDQQVRLTVRDPGWDILLSTVVTLNEFGTFHTSLTLDRSASPGSYTISLSEPTPPQEGAADSNSGTSFASGSFTVAEYRKPAFEVTVTPNQTELVQDETLTMQVNAQYYAGGVVDNAPVRWWLTAQPFSFQSDAYPSYRFDNIVDPYAWYRGEDDNSGGELVGDGTATTDDQGRLVLDFPASLGDDNQNRTLTLDVEVTDVDGQIIASRGRVRVYAGAFAVGLRPDGYVTEVGEPQSVSLITIDVQNQQDQQDQTIGNIPLDIAVYKREWYSVREQGADGQMYWTSAYSETLVASESVQTDAQGRTTTTFTPREGGTYRVEATGHDSNGHTVQASAFTWAYGGDVFWGVNDSNRIDLVADKSQYAPGDTARILVPAPYTGMRALVTIEREQIIEHRIITIDDSTELLEVPITDAYVPNVYVSVVLIKPALAELPVPDVRVGLINLPVTADHKQLNVQVTPDTEQASPRDDVTYSVRVTDHDGNGVQTELSLALVDKAVLALADDPNPTLLEAFYTTRPLGVFTAQSLTTLVDRMTVDLDEQAKGGGGGMGDDMPVREDFQDTAYWNPSVVTDEQGEAQVTLTLPDNVTTWHMTARGITMDTLVGDGHSDLLSTRPLLVRPSLPRFLTVGDEPVIQAVVQNNTASDIDATVSFETAGMDVSTPATQDVTVPANDEVVVRWQASVAPDGIAPGTDSIPLHFGVTSDKYQDAVQQNVPLQRLVTPETVASAGQVFDTPVVETLVYGVPDGGPPMGELHLELVPSLAAGVETGLDYLETYPYGCTEQTVSRFLPNAVTYRLLTQAGMGTAGLQDDLERNLSQGLQRLSYLQQPDGGWGWWETDPTSPYITAYVLQGLLEAERAGYGVSPQMLDEAVAYLEAALDAETDAETDTADTEEPPPRIISDDVRAYVLYVLAEAGEPDLGRTIVLYDQRHSLSLASHAYLLMTLHAQGGQDERVQTLVADLMSRATLHTTDAHWEEATTDYRTMGSDTRTTALVLQALVRADPQNMLVPNAVRYLMQVREQGHWRTTYETALSLMALSDYLAYTGELEASYTYRAAIDGQTVRDGSIDRESIQTTIEEVVGLADLASSGDAGDTGPAASGQHTTTLALEKDGQGRLYYTVRLHTFQDASDAQPLDRGIQVHRRYVAVDPVTLEPTGEPVVSVNVGDVVQVRLSLDVPATMHYLTVEDMLPAGFEVLDNSLNTVASTVDGPTLSANDNDRDRPPWWFVAQTEIHDNRVALFATELPRGSYSYTYLVRAAIPGTYQAPPATAYQMYAPEVFGRSAGAQVVVAQP